MNPIKKRKRTRSFEVFLGLMILILLPAWGIDSEGLRQLNRIRKSCGMIALHANKALAKAAYRHAKYLGRLRKKGHLERAGSSYSFGRTPFDRIARAGYPACVGVENISYGDRSYRESVRTLMSTIYHRLAFLDFRIDEMGSSEYGNKKGRIYVYDMAPSTVARLCQSSESFEGEGAYVRGVCSHTPHRVSRSTFQYALASVERRNPSIVCYPFSGMHAAARSFVRETPDPLPRVYGAGLPITAQFNPSKYRHVKLTSFDLYDARGERIKSRVLQAKNDPHHKLARTTFVLVPLVQLRRASCYRVKLSVVADGKELSKSWSFTTK